jgi:hypothetical protein
MTTDREKAESIAEELREEGDLAGAGLIYATLAEGEPVVVVASAADQTYEGYLVREKAAGIGSTENDVVGERG